MTMIKKLLSTIFLIPFTVQATETLIEIKITENEIVKLQEAEILDEENMIRLNTVDQTIAGPSELINELKKRGFIKEENASQSTDCKRT